jgi:hypothetical protein
MSSIEDAVESGGRTATEVSSACEVDGVRIEVCLPEFEYTSVSL